MKSVEEIEVLQRKVENMKKEVMILIDKDEVGKIIIDEVANWKIYENIMGRINKLDKYNVVHLVGEDE